jgi:putative hemolysin
MEVNVRKIIGSKNPKLLKRMPNFILNWMERFIHQDEINQTLEAGRHHSGVPFIQKVFEMNDIKVQSEFLDRIPKKGGCIIAANHPLGGLDGMAVMHEIAKVRSDFLFLANDILTNITPLKELFLPVNRIGNTNRKSLALISEAYSSGKAILIFPSGFVSRKINGQIKDLPWQKSLVQKAKEHQLPIIPLFIHGQNSKRFYRIAQWRKLLGIKLNIEMLTLPDELFKQKKSTIKMVFGLPIRPETFKSGKPIDWSKKIMDLVYQIPNNPNATLQ